MTRSCRSSDGAVRSRFTATSDGCSGLSTPDPTIRQPVAHPKTGLHRSKPEQIKVNQTLPPLPGTLLLLRGPARQKRQDLGWIVVVAFL